MNHAAKRADVTRITDIGSAGGAVSSTVGSAAHA
ncbi:hypothetical protein MYCO108962_21850 [Mycobacterium colombiense]